MISSDIVIDLAYGDSGKGKVTKDLTLKSLKKNPYTHCLKFNGGPNAGHTMYENGKKFVTHQVPCGVFYNIKSIIGATCVINPKSLFEEIEELEAGGINVKKNLLIAKNAHIITEEHLNNDGKDTKIGTTKRGIGPCYADKANRTGIRAKDVEELKPFLVDQLELFTDKKSYLNVICEGSQGFYLDVDWGDYPYVTSSVCTVAGAVQNGIHYKSINKVYGVIKAYETYVGEKNFQPDDPIFNELRELGGEYGATTGRPRKCNWLNLDNLVKAIQFNNVTNLIINKCDIIKKLNKFCVIKNNEVITLNNYIEFQSIICNTLYNEIPWEYYYDREDINTIIFSEYKDRI